jgi:hypothetical protein
VLWLVFSSVSNNFLSQAFINEAKESLNDTGVVVLNGQNPVLKMPVLVSAADGTVYIDELAGVDDGFTIPGAAGGEAYADAVVGRNDRSEEAGAAGDAMEQRQLSQAQVQANMRMLGNNRFAGSGDHDDFEARSDGPEKRYEDRFGWGKTRHGARI